MGQKLTMPSPIATYAFPDLTRRLRPVSADLPEANIDVIYDTQTYLAAGSAQLQFFTNVNADPTLSNMELAGALAADTFFDIHRIFIDYNRVPSATVANTAAGVATDIATILHTARGTLTFSQLQKPVGPIPLTFIGSSGSVEARIGSGRADAAGAIIQIARGPDNGGWPANASIKLGPQTKFGVTLNFVSTAVGADVPIRVSFLGIRYRRLA